MAIRNLVAKWRSNDGPNRGTGSSGDLDGMTAGRRSTPHRTMTSYERNSNYIGLKPTWKGGLLLIFVVAVIVGGILFTFY
jgi:hypothetical protein